MLSGSKHCSQPPSTVALSTSYRIPISGRVTVISKCQLKEKQRYFFGTNLKLGYLNKGMLMLGCAQEDVEYMLYELNKKQTHQSCC